MATILNASTSSGLVQSADTSGQLELQSNGSTKLTVSSTGVSGTIVQGTAVASTSGTSIDFTGIPSWAKRITVMFRDVSTSGTSNMLIQLGDSGGIENTGYSSSAITKSAAGTTVVGTTSTAGFLATGYIPAASSSQTGSYTICNFSSNEFVLSGVTTTNTGDGNTAGGSKTLSATLDRIRITTVGAPPTDTFDAGSINIQYEG